MFNDEDVDDDEVVRTKSIVPKEMSLDEAIMKMELLGHDFFIIQMMNKKLRLLQTSRWWLRLIETE